MGCWAQAHGPCALLGGPGRKCDGHDAQRVHDNHPHPGDDPVLSSLVPLSWADGGPRAPRELMACGWADSELFVLEVSFEEFSDECRSHFPDETRRAKGLVRDMRQTRTEATRIYCESLESLGPGDVLNTEPVVRPQCYVRSWTTTERRRP